LVEDADGLIARAVGQIDADMMDRAPRLRVIGRHGVGVDNVDVEAATERGIYVVNTPLANAYTVAEHTVGVLLCLSRRIFEADRAVRQGEWAFRNYGMGHELCGKRLGIIGFGKIGRHLAGICRLGFGMEIVYYDQLRFPDEEQRLGVSWASLDELLSTSDVISIHMPLSPATHHLIGQRELSLVKQSVFFLNASRGSVVDGEALVDALTSKRIAGAGLDVFEVEPLPPHHPLMTLEHVILTPHIAGHSRESAVKLAMVAADVIRVLNSEEPEFPVNRPRLS
ncbi:MAG: hydroxyacid dehydrogenase, partial [Candidatus Latescibacteria bacterium]|nr:hydroxyacid dehydrogenase [Candidatus Latescibacterota bacterium]